MVKETMRAVVVREGRAQLVPDYPIRKPGEGELLLRVVRAGICDTDLQILQGYMRYEGVLGHEFVGVPTSGRLKGQLVACEINCACGECDFCRGGLRNHCPKRTVLGIAGADGGFADYVIVPERNVHPIPDGIHAEVAVFVEPLAAAFQITRQVPLDRSCRCLVLGDGKLGYLVAQVLKLAGCQVTVRGKYREKLHLFERLGISVELVGERPLRPEYPVVVDCTGSSLGLQDALQAVRPRGTIVLKTTVAGSSGPNLAPVVVHEVQLLGSRCGPFPTALEALRTRQIDVEPLIEEVYSLSRAEEALERAARPGARKILLAPDESWPSLRRVRT
jgi:threonine dehydrogenase-like Zn-dependent dehydrogenase